MANFPLSPFDPALIFQFSYTTLPAMHPALLVLKDLKSQNKILPDIKKKKKTKWQLQHVATSLSSLLLREVKSLHYFDQMSAMYIQ